MVRLPHEPGVISGMRKVCTNRREWSIACQECAAALFRRLPRPEHLGLKIGPIRQGLGIRHLGDGFGEDVDGDGTGDVHVGP